MASETTLEQMRTQEIIDQLVDENSKLRVLVEAGQNGVQNGWLNDQRRLESTRQELGNEISGLRAQLAEKDRQGREQEAEIGRLKEELEILQNQYDGAQELSESLNAGNLNHHRGSQQEIRKLKAEAKEKDAELQDLRGLLSINDGLREELLRAEAKIGLLQTTLESLQTTLDGVIHQARNRKNELKHEIKNLKRKLQIASQNSKTKSRKSFWRR